MSNIEKTLSIIKPDAVERNLVDNIKDIFIKNNLNIKDTKKIQITRDEASEFYKVHQSKPFYNDLCNYLSSGPIVVMQQIQKMQREIQLGNYMEYQLKKIQYTDLILQRTQKKR